MEPPSSSGSPQGVSNAASATARYFTSPAAANRTEEIHSGRQSEGQRRPAVLVRGHRPPIITTSDCTNPVVKFAQRATSKLKNKTQSRACCVQKAEAHLIGLPRDVRVKILSHLLPDIPFVPAHHFNCRKRKSKDYLPLRKDHQSCTPAVLLVCQQIYEEAMDCLYSALTFELRISTAGIYFTTHHIPGSFNFAFKIPRAGEPWTADQSQFLGLLWPFVYKNRSIHVHARGTRLDMFSGFVSYARMSPKLKCLSFDLTFDEREKLEILLGELDTIRGLDSARISISSRTIASTDQLQMAYINCIAANMMTRDAPPVKIHRMSDWFGKFDETVRRADRTLWFDCEAEYREARAAYRSGDLNAAATACEELQKRWNELVRRVQEQYLLATAEITELARQVEENQAWLLGNAKDEGEGNVVISRKQAAEDERADSLLSSAVRPQRHSLSFFNKRPS